MSAPISNMDPNEVAKALKKLTTSPLQTSVIGSIGGSRNEILPPRSVSRLARVAICPRRDPDRGAGDSHGKGQGRQGGPRRVYLRMPGLPRRPGHLLCRDLEGRRTRLPADLRRHLRRGRLRQALRPKDPLTAADLLNDRVIPFYEKHDIPLQRVPGCDRATKR